MSYFVLGNLLYLIIVYIPITDNEKIKHRSLSDGINSSKNKNKKTKGFLVLGSSSYIPPFHMIENDYFILIEIFI